MIWAAFIVACVAFCGLVLLLAIVFTVARKVRPYLAMLGLGDTFGNPGGREE